MRFTSQHKAINQKEYGKAVSPLRYDSLALILSWSIFVVYGKQSEKNKYICSSKRHSALHTFWDTTLASHPSCKVSAHLKQMCENGTSCNILFLHFDPIIKIEEQREFIISLCSSKYAC